MSSDNRLPRLIFVGLVLVAAVQAAHYHPLLADRLASHFDNSGSPNGWQSKGVFFGFYVGGIVLSAVLAFGIPRIIQAAPNETFNLPNKEYWLAPGRREQTVAFLDNAFAWFGCATLFLMMTAIELAIRANLHSSPRLASSILWWILGGYFLFVLVWLFRLIGHFARTP